MNKPIIIQELDDLIKQATEERSHYYVKSVAEKAQLAIGMLMGNSEKNGKRLQEAEVLIKDLKEYLFYIGGPTRDVKTPYIQEAIERIREWEKNDNS